MKPYTTEELDYIRLNYPILGPRQCGKNLNRDYGAIGRIARKWGLKTEYKWIKSDKERCVNPQYFRDVNLPEIAYFLGYFWADGYIHKKMRLSKKMNKQISIRIAIELIDEDAMHLGDKINHLMQWNIQRRKRRERGATMTTLLTCSIPLYQILYDLDYDVKSFVSPSKVLAHIPTNLHPSFWLGFFDGDGCATKSKRGHFGLHFVGSFEQDWKDLECLLNDLGIKYSLYRKKSNGGNSSAISIRNQAGVRAFFRYIKPFERLGLPRKQAKFHEFIKEHPELSEAGIDQGTDI